MSSTTDPARELAALIDKLRSFPSDPAGNQQQPPLTSRALAAGFALEENSALFLEILATIRWRLDRFERFVGALSDPLVGPDVIGEVRTAIGSVATAFMPGRFTAQWQEALKLHVTAHNATTLRMFSPTAQRYMPLRLLTDAERQEALGKVQEALAEIKESEDFDVWEREALLYGFQRLEIVFRYFEVFGHETLAREVALANVATSAVLQTRPAAPLKKAIAALVVAARIVEVVAAPDVAITAAIHYEHLLGLGAPAPQPVRLLEAPKEAPGEAKLGDERSA